MEVAGGGEGEVVVGDDPAWWRRTTGRGDGVVGISLEIVILLVARRVMREGVQKIPRIDIFKYANCILSARP